MLAIELVAGSFSERAPGGAIHNTSVHVSPDGELRAVYRKIHMFDVTVDGVEYRESDDETPGEEIVVSQTDGGVELGMSICYDLRFPELYRILALRGARVICWSRPRSRSRRRATTGRRCCARARSRTRRS